LVAGARGGGAARHHERGGSGGAGRPRGHRGEDGGAGHRRSDHDGGGVLTVYFGAPSMFITLWFGFDYGTNPPLGTLII
jgi:hypothetical protein